MHPHWDWYEREQKRRKDAREANDVSLINRNLQRILHQIDEHIDRNDYEEEATKASLHLTHSGIWDIWYANNLENKAVALDQALFIQAILHKGDIPDSCYIDEQVDRHMRRLGNVDWSLFTEYSQRKQLLTRKQ